MRRIIMALIFSFYFSVVMVIAYPLMDNAMTIFHLFNLQNKGYQKMRVVVIVLAIIAWKKLKQGQLF